MNRKKFFGSIAVLAIAAMTAFNVNVSSKESGLSGVSLDNVEALASEYIYIHCTGYPVPLVCFWYNGQPMAAGYATVYI